MADDSVLPPNDEEEEEGSETEQSTVPPPPPGFPPPPPPGFSPTQLEDLPILEADSLEEEAEDDAAGFEGLGSLFG